MNQIPNIEETHNTEVEEARQKLNKVYLRLAYGKSDIETAKREVDEILHHQLQKAPNLEELSKAWHIEGRNPEYHREQKALLAKNWPSLYQAIVKLL